MAKIERVSRKHGLMIVNPEDRDFFHCCNQCEVASSLGSVEECPQRIHTANSCCPSCSLFIEHGIGALLTHWGDQAQILVGFQIVVPLNSGITEEILRAAFHLHKVPLNQLHLLYEWHDSRTLDISFENHSYWTMTIRHIYWPLDLQNPFLRDALIYGLTGYPERAAVTIYSHLRNLFNDFSDWVRRNYNIEPVEIFNIEEKNNRNTVSYYASFFLRFENAENITVDILSPDYERSSDPESCIVRLGISQIPAISFQKVNSALVMRKGLETAWGSIELSLQKMLEELSEITSEMRSSKPVSAKQIGELLDRIQVIQVQFLKLKPIISNMQGALSPLVPLLSEPLIQQLLPSFNLNLVNSWFEFSKAVERSIDGANSYIQGKMNILAIDQEKKTTKRLNLLTALFGCLSGLNLIVAFLSWGTPNPNQELLVLSGSLILFLIVLTLLIVGGVLSRD